MLRTNLLRRHTGRRMVRKFAQPDHNNMMPIDIGNHPAVFAYRDCIWTTTGFCHPWHVMYQFATAGMFAMTIYAAVFTPNDIWIKTGSYLSFWEMNKPHQCRDDLDELMAADPYPPHPNLESILKNMSK